ncbi:MAG: tetratricopeptide repeat protein [Parvularculales bacterium]
MSDIFREVERDLRRERYMTLWRKYGFYVVGVVVVVALVVVAFAGVRSWTISTVQEASRQYDLAVKSLEEVRREEVEATEDTIVAARETLALIAKGGPEGYRTLAQLQEAALLSETGNWEEAVHLYDMIANNRSLPLSLRNVARVRAGFVMIGKVDTQELQDRLGDVAQSGQPMRNMAREVLGLAKFLAGQTEQARSYYSSIINDPSSPSGLLERAYIMMTVLGPRAPAGQFSSDGSSSANPPF